MNNTADTMIEEMDHAILAHSYQKAVDLYIQIIENLHNNVFQLEQKSIMKIDEMVAYCYWKLKRFSLALVHQVSAEWLRARIIAGDTSIKTYDQLMRVYCSIKQSFLDDLQLTLVLSENQTHDLDSVKQKANSIAKSLAETLN